MAMSMYFSPQKSPVQDYKETKFKKRLHVFILSKLNVRNISHYGQFLTVIISNTELLPSKPSF
jgi:hypothetical protein